MTRQTAISFLHNHLAMIDLNPLVISRKSIPPLPHCPPEETACAWYLITDKLNYLPGTDLFTGLVTYTCAFHDLPTGLQTHCYAGLGTEIRDKWTVGGSEEGEEPEKQELGLGAPASGLYLREDVDFKCNILVTGFVKKTLKKAHIFLAEKLATEAQRGREGSADKQVLGGGSPGDAFVSSGANQGQPGQGSHNQPYAVSGLHEVPGTINTQAAHEETETEGQNSLVQQQQ